MRRVWQSGDVIAGRLLRTRARRWWALAVVVLVAAAVVVAVWPRPGPREIVAQDEKITVPGGPDVDGTVTLDAGLYLPSATPAPAVIVAHGFGGSRASVDADAQRLARAGFVVLAYSARGFGASTGRIGLDSLDYEVADGRALVDWLSHRPEVAQDGAGDPRVGVTGGSYGGALALMLAGTDQRVDAVAAVATWNNLTESLFPNNVSVTSAQAAPPPAATPARIPTGTDGVFKRSWAAALMSSVISGSSLNGAGASLPAAPTAGVDGPGGDPATGGSTGEASGGAVGAGPSASCGRLMVKICAAYVQVAQSGRLTSAMAALLDNSSPSRVASKISAPTLLVQGENDTLFGLDQADATARAIAANGTPVAVSWYAGGHNGGEVDQATQDRVTGWLEHYLAGTGPVPSEAFRYSVAGPRADSGRIRHRTLELPGYPGLGRPAAPVLDVPLGGPAQTILNPPGALPAAISSLPGVGNLGGALGALSAIPGQTAIFTSAPVDSTTVVTGSPTVTLSVSRVAGAPAPGASGISDDPGAPRDPGTAGGGPDDEAGAGAAGSGDDEISAVLYVSLAAVDGAGGDGDASATQPAGRARAGDADGTPGADETAGSAPTSGPDSGTSRPPASDQAGAAQSTGAQPTGAQSRPGSIAALLAGSPAGGAVAPVRIDGLRAGEPSTVTVHLPAVVFQLQPGQSFEVRVATTDQGYAGPTSPAVYRVSLAGHDTLHIPAAGGTRVSGGEEPVALLAGLGLLALLAIVALGLAGRAPRAGARRRGRGIGPTGEPGVGPNLEPKDGIGAPESAPVGPPVLEIFGLRKRYPGGVTAVENVSFRVERGQVLGLLGPNGAGKTTTLRMVMGLITATAGEIRLFGEPVRPGAPILSRVGSFVEGSGFLPHLSGHANLRLFWRATGRPRAAAHLEQALQIADLGAAAKRRVKTYSQGMRRRLAIAQAMLGLPDLLLMDEPTNGLDPPQIHVMREVLRRYAATGRTVLISSHLLSEVEQTCSHVVIVDRGRTIAAGRVADLVSASGEMHIGTPEPAAAQAVLQALDGIGDLAPAADGLLVDLGSVPVDTVLRRLLDAGIPVTAAAPRNRLEDVFLDLVGAGAPAGGAATPVRSPANGGQNR